jgi:deoxyribodipyrimidine photo-lyase
MAKTAIVWFRRDLRLADNPALQHALEHADHIVPAFIWAPDEEQPWAPGGASRWWLHHSLESLGAALSRLGSPLVLRRGDSLAELRQLVRDSGAGAVYWNRLYEPAVIARDRHIKEALREDGLEAESFNGALLLEPWQLKTGGGEPYRVFTPFWKNALTQLPDARMLLPAPKRLSPPPGKPLQGLSASALELLPTIPWDLGFHSAWTPGSQGAQARLERFCDEAAADYSQRRDLPGVAGTSGLSPHLHFGEIGPRQVLARMQRLMAEQPTQGLMANAEHYLREIGWREFGHHLLFHFPRTPQAPMYDKFAAFPWRKADDYADDLRAWRRGRTGVPIVDAGMRELWTTGWMHNRVRMIVASFLTKNLLIPWQEGAAWFWDTLVDADLAGNTLGWQWAAGCGADAAPYFRIFNPVLQSQKFDAAGAYLRRWVPELARLPDAALHAPWAAKPALLAAAKLRLGQDYPLPLVDLGESRERALAAYEGIR